MIAKFDINKNILEDSTDPVSLVVDLSKYEDIALGIIYGAIAPGNIEISGSTDGDPAHFSVISTQAVDIAGGYHLVNCDNFHFQFLRIDMPASAGTTIRLQAERNRD